MEQDTVLKQVLNALSVHSKQLNAKMEEGFAEVNDRMDQRFAEVDKRFDAVDQRFAEVDNRFDVVEQKIDHLNKKVDGLRINLHETQETAEFSASKVIQHEKKLREINM
jgi:chromosome segregation ATPase